MSTVPYTIEEATKALGVSDKTIRRMLGSGVLREHSRDGRRILIDPASVDAVALATGRQVTPRNEVREIAPTLNANAEATLVAINALKQIVDQQYDRIFELQRQLAEVEARQRLLPSLEEVSALQHELRELRAENEELKRMIG